MFAGVLMQRQLLPPKQARTSHASLALMLSQAHSSSTHSMPVTWEGEGEHRQPRWRVREVVQAGRLIGGELLTMHAGTRPEQPSTVVYVV